MLPVIVATVRAVARGWVPLSDDAYFSIRATDVFSSQIPLVGLATSASLNAKQHLNHPGPILFDLLAVPVRLFGSTAGVAIGIGITNSLAIAGACWVAFRRGGVMLVIPAALVSCGLTWAMGSELLFDPWQPHALLLPFLCFLLLAWGLAEGDLVLLPFGVGVASLLVETHVSYAYLVPALGIVGVLGLAWRLRTRVQRGEEAREHLRRRLAVVGAVTVAVLAVCWAQPVVDQIARRGNLLHLLDASRASGPTLGSGRAMRVVASVVSLPPFFLRDSFSSTLAAAGTSTGGPGGVGLAHLPSLALAIASFAALVIVLLAAAAIPWWRRRDGRAAAPVIALVGLAVGYFTATRIPIEVFGVAQHNFRWLWPLGAFGAFAVIAVVIRWLTGTSAVAGRAGVAATSDDAVDDGAVPAPLATGARIVGGVGIGLVALLVVLTVPTYDAGVGPNLNLWAEPVLRDIDHQIAEHPPRGPLLADFSNTFFLEPFSTPLLAQLQRSGVGFVTDDATQVRQIGADRRFDGRNARARLVYRQGKGATETPPGWHRIAFHVGLDRSRRRELLELEASGKTSARRTDLERRWNRDTIGVFVAPLHGPSARDTP